MRAVVLVGGFGTRLRPLTLDTPKQMLPVCGITMFERVLRALGEHGVTEAILSLGFRPQAFTDAFPDAVCAGVELTYAIEPEPLDTAGAIRFAATEAALDETFLVVNGDVLTDLAYSDLIDAHHRFGGEATIHLTPVADPSRFGVVPTDTNGLVLEFVEKPDPGTEPTNQINAGTYVMEPSVLDRIPAGVRCSVERETFPALVADEVLFASSTDDYWLDAGTPQAYLQANLDLAFGARRVSVEPVDPSAAISAAAHVEGSVVGRASVAEGAILDGSLIMDGATIGPRARVVDSIVAAGASVGADSRILRGSVVGFGATVADSALLTDGATEPSPETWGA